MLPDGTPHCSYSVSIQIAPTKSTDAANGRQDSLIAPQLQSGVRTSFLEPNDAAISKYARGEERDRRWIREGLRASILSLATLEYRSRETDFLDWAEHDRVKGAIREDRDWVGQGFIG